MFNEFNNFIENKDTNPNNPINQSSKISKLNKWHDKKDAEKNKIEKTRDIVNIVILNSKDVDLKNNTLEEINSGNEHDSYSDYDNNPTILAKSINIKLDGNICGMSLSNNKCKGVFPIKFVECKLLNLSTKSFIIPKLFSLIA